MTYFSYVTFAYDFHLFHFSEIIHLNIFLEFLSFVYMTYKLSILPNYARRPKELVPCYTLSFFTILKSPHPTDQLACLEKMTSVRGRKRLTQRGRTSKALQIHPSSYRSGHENQDYKDPLGSNKPPARPPKAPSVGSPQAPPPKVSVIAQYS